MIDCIQAEDEVAKMQSALLEGLTKKGYRARMVSVRHLAELERDITNMCDKNMSPEFKSFVMHCFDFRKPKDLPDTASILITAVASPRVRVYFNPEGKRVPLLLPPSYVEMSSNSGSITEIIKAIPELKGYDTTEAHLPEKLLAVRSGLGRYGRNNICYIPGMGSFVRLAAFYTNIQCSEDNWNEAQLMSTCDNCGICFQKCPTGSIVKERVLVNAERCICYLNETEGEFPEWLDPSWHNSIIGCFLCQESCPANRDMVGQVVDMGEFTQEETDMILDGEPLVNLTEVTVKKMERIDLVHYYHRLARNLKVLLAKAIDI